MHGAVDEGFGLSDGQDCPESGGNETGVFGDGSGMPSRIRCDGGANDHPVIVDFEKKGVYSSYTSGFLYFRP